jgi:hypothetical protein
MKHPGFGVPGQPYIAVLELTGEARDSARRFLGTGMIPVNAVEDAPHVAIATVHGRDYPVTWNCRHIANAEIVKRLAEVAEDLGYELPALCTPEQSKGD